MLNIKNLSFQFSGTLESEKILFSNLNLSIEPGEIVFIFGENGVGKSTFFKLVSGDLQPKKGSISVNNQDLKQLSYFEKSQLIATVFQNPEEGTFSDLTVFENLAIAYKRGKGRGLNLFSNAELKLFFEKELSSFGFGLEKRLNEVVKNLSGGQKQSLSALMALIAESKLVLLDEITAALNPEARVRIMQYVINYLQKHNRSALIITHNLEVVPAECKKFIIKDKKLQLIEML